MVEVFSFLDLLFAGDRSAFLSCGPSSRLASFLGVKCRRPLSLRSFGLQNSLQRGVHSSESYCVVTVAVVVFACGLRFQTSGGPSMSVPWSLSGNRSSVISVSAAFGIVGFVSARLSLSFFSPACRLLGGSPPSMFVRRGLLELVLVLSISTRRLKWFVVESAMYCFIVGGSCSDWLSQRHCCFSWTSNHNKCGFLGSSSTYPAVAKRVAKVCVKVELSVSRIPTSGGCLIVGLPCPNLAKLHVPIWLDPIKLGLSRGGENKPERERERVTDSQPASTRRTVAKREHLAYSVLACAHAPTQNSSAAAGIASTAVLVRFPPATGSLPSSQNPRLPACTKP
ncbi:hypothetical protein YC2023_084432 [Brassica napus]